MVSSSWIYKNESFRLSIDQLVSRVGNCNLRPGSLSTDKHDAHHYRRSRSSVSQNPCCPQKDRIYAWSTKMRRQHHWTARYMNVKTGSTTMADITYILRSPCHTWQISYMQQILITLYYKVKTELRYCEPQNRAAIAYWNRRTYVQWLWAWASFKYHRWPWLCTVRKAIGILAKPLTKKIGSKHKNIRSQRICFHID